MVSLVFMSLKMKILILSINFFLASFTCLTTLANSFSSIPTPVEFLEEAKAFAPYLRDVRRVLHQHPESCYEEYYTSAFIKKKLEELGISYTEGWGISVFNTSTGGTGIVADIGTGKSPCVALRADMDGLPILELTNISFKSLTPGRMHACGHDAHITMLLGAAKLLKKYEKNIPGTIRLIFQPAEEGGGGALMMLKEGVLERLPAVESIFGLHVSPDAPTGFFVSRAGNFMAAVDIFDIVLYGQGGHAALHHQTIDPITAALAVIRGFYDIYAREFSVEPNHWGLLSVTSIHAGTTFNVIPCEIAIKGTFRSHSIEHLNYIRKRLKDVTENTAKAYRCTYTFQTSPIPYDPVVNDAHQLEIFKDVAEEISPVKTVIEASFTMGGEDFGFFSQRVPAVYTQLGTGNGTHTLPTNRSLHSDYFALDENVLPYGVAVHTATAFRFLEELQTHHGGNPSSMQKTEL